MTSLDRMHNFIIQSYTFYLILTTFNFSFVAISDMALTDYADFSNIGRIRNHPSMYLIMVVSTQIMAYPFV